MHGLELASVGLQGGTRRSQHHPGSPAIWEDAFWNTPLEVVLVEVERLAILRLRWQLHEVELVVGLAHLLFPVAILVVLLEPEELLVEQLRQDALWSETHFVSVRHFDLLARALPERRFLAFVEVLRLDNVGLHLAHRLD